MNNEMDSDPKDIRLAVSTKERDYQIDNMKAILIYFVVLGHVMTSMIDQSNIIRGIYIFIYLFHMPAMVFISGYLSKNLDKSRERAFISLLVPFLILNVFYYFLRVVILQEEYFGFRFLHPLRGLWYLLALFIWKFFLKDLIKIRFLLPLSILLGLFSGFTREFSGYLSLGRVVGMLPFFLLGYYSTKEKHWKVISNLPKSLSIGAILFTSTLSAYLARDEGFQKSALYLRGPYPQEAELEGLFLRLMIYIIAFIMICAMINLTSSKKLKITRIGASTLTIYVIHLYIVNILERFAILIDYPIAYIPYAIVISIIFVYVLSRSSVKRGYDWVLDKLTNTIIKKKQ